jgi:ribose transport system substrate-binding protein
MKNLISISKIATFFFSLSLVFMTSCNTSENKNGNSQNEQPKKKTVYLVLKSLGNPFFKDIQTGVEGACDSTIDLQVRSGKDESDVAGQAQILKSILDASTKEEISGVILTPSSSGEELISSIKQLRNKGIPVILVDTKIDSAVQSKNGVEQLPFITSSNMDGGKQAAEYIVSKLPKGKTSILLLGGVESQETANQRKYGFENYLNSLPTKYNIQYREAKWNRIEAQTITASFYSAGTKFDAIFGANDEMALGALQATMNKKISPRPIIVGFDAIEEARTSIKNEGINATIAQNPKEMGSKSVELLNALWKKETIENNNFIPTQLIK